MIAITSASNLLRTPERTDAYPEQPVAEAFQGAVQGILGDRVVVRTGRGIRLLQQGRLPRVFLPPTALLLKHVRPSDTLRMDDIGLAVHLHIASGGYVARDAAWYYPGPDPELAIIAGMICLDPSRFGSLTFDGQPVSSGDQPGGWLMPNMRYAVRRRHDCA